MNSLDSRVPDRASALRASGLPPAQFAAAERDFRTAVQSVSSGGAQTLSGPSDAVNSAFAASLTAAPTTRPIRPSPLAATSSPSRSKEALLAKAQAIQAGSLFDQTMRAAPDTIQSASKGKANDGVAPATSAAASGAVEGSAQSGARDQAEVTGGDVSSEMRPRRYKRRRMAKVVFGLAIHSSLNRLDDEEEANDERRRRHRIHHLQSTMERLRSSDPTWRYLDAPRDFLVTVSPSSESSTPL